MKEVARKMKLWGACVAVLIYSFPRRVFAQLNETDGPSPGVLTNPLGDKTLIDLLNIILDAIVLLMIPIIVLMVIYAGFTFVTAQGNQEKLSRAKTMLLWTLVGALIILAAEAILTLITNSVESLGS